MEGRFPTTVQQMFADNCDATFAALPPDVQESFRVWFYTGASAMLATIIQELQGEPDPSEAFQAVVLGVMQECHAFCTDAGRVTH